MGLNTRDQAYIDTTEVEAAIEYAEIAAEYDVPVTLFCTGKCVVEEPTRMARLAAMNNVELGGHNYWAFNTPIHAGWRALEKVTGGRVGSWMGPRQFQAYEIRKTIATFGELNIEVTAWRDHAYRHDQHTIELIAEAGITHFSDPVEPNGVVRKQSDITVVPINTPPDHEHIYHAFRTPGFVAEDGVAGPFGSESRKPEEWVDWVLDHRSEHSHPSSVTTILAHPACMRIADGFDSLRTLLRTLSRTERQECLQMSQINPVS
jgi:hypothetical protein